jgi:hypothetical protein
MVSTNDESQIQIGHPPRGRMGKIEIHIYRRLAMKGKIGCPTKIVTLPRCVRELAKHKSVKLPDKAKRRLEALDWYYKKSSYYSSSKKPDVKLTRGHFGI